MQRITSVPFAMLVACASTSESPTTTTTTTASASTSTTATAETTDATPTTAASDTTVELRPGTTVTQPAGFSMTRRADALAFVDPDREMAVWYVVVDEGTIDQAIAAAWQRAQPGFALPLKETTKPPTRDGWDEQAQADYTTPATSSRAVFAFARRTGTTTYVVCVDALLASLGKRGAQLGTLLMSLKAPGVREERFVVDAVQPLTTERIEHIMAFVDETRRAYRIPGVSMAIVAAGKVQASRVFGVVEAGKATPVTPNTLFMIGSTTKPLTTLLEASLVDDGAFTWDTPLTDVLPGFSLADPVLTKKVLLRHTACACTGMPRRDFDFLFEFASATPAQRVAQMSTMTPTTGFGEVFQYSNWMVGMGGYAAAHAAYPKLELGVAYDTAMRERIFKPLGMTSTTLDFTDVARRDHAMPHADDASGTIRGMRLYDEQGVVAMRPAGGVWSTANDMAKYVLAELNMGRLPDGKQLVSEASLLERRAPRTKITDEDYYGLGLFIEQYSGLTVVKHGGNNLGFTSDLWFVPELGIGVSILSNKDSANGFHGAVKRKIFETLFNGKDEAAGRVAFAARNAAEAYSKHGLELVAVDDAFATRVVGRYRDPSLGELVVTRTGDTVIVDAGEWRSATRKNVADKTVDLLELFDPPFAGMSFIIGEAGGARTLTLDAGQQKYVFTEVK